MTAVAGILAVAFLAASLLCVILGVAYDRRGDVIEGLRDQLASESKVAKHWYDKAQQLYTRLEWSGNVTPSFVGERPSLSLDEHTADAQQRIEGGRVVRLPRQGGRA